MKMQAGITEKGQAAGEIRNSSDPQTLCMMIHQTFVSTLFMWCIHNGTFDLPLYIRSSVEAMLDVKPELRAHPGLSLTDIWCRDEGQAERNDRRPAGSGRTAHEAAGRERQGTR